MGEVYPDLPLDFEAALLKAVLALSKVRSAFLGIPTALTREGAIRAVDHCEKILQAFEPPLDDRQPGGGLLMSGRSLQEVFSEFSGMLRECRVALDGAPRTEAVEEALRELAVAREALEAAIADVRQKGA